MYSISSESYNWRLTLVFRHLNLIISTYTALDENVSAIASLLRSCGSWLVADLVDDDLDVESLDCFAVYKRFSVSQ